MKQAPKIINQMSAFILGTDINPDTSSPVSGFLIKFKNNATDFEINADTKVIYRIINGDSNSASFGKVLATRFTGIIQRDDDCFADIIIPSVLNTTNVFQIQISLTPENSSLTDQEDALLEAYFISNKENSTGWSNIVIRNKINATPTKNCYFNNNDISLSLGENLTLRPTQNVSLNLSIIPSSESYDELLWYSIKLGDSIKILKARPSVKNQISHIFYNDFVQLTNNNPLSLDVIYQTVKGYEETLHIGNIEVAVDYNPYMVTSIPQLTPAACGIKKIDTSSIENNNGEYSGTVGVVLDFINNGNENSDNYEVPVSALPYKYALINYYSETVPIGVTYTYDIECKFNAHQYTIPYFKDKSKFSITLESYELTENGGKTGWQRKLEFDKKNIVTTSASLANPLNLFIRVGENEDNRVIEEIEDFIDKHSTPETAVDINGYKIQYDKNSINKNNLVSNGLVELNNIQIRYTGNEYTDKALLKSILIFLTTNISITITKHVNFIPEIYASPYFGSNLICLKASPFLGLDSSQMYNYQVERITKDKPSEVIASISDKTFATENAEFLYIEDRGVDFGLPCNYKVTTWAEKAGQTYLADYETTNINTPTIMSNDIILMDASNILHVTYNPDINGIKYNTQDSIVTTLGSQYPYIRRNGHNYYRTFNIGGLISYNSENSEIAELIPTTSTNISPTIGGMMISTFQYSPMIKDMWNYEFDYINSNRDREILLERVFRERAINFLCNDKVKLFKSATEGSMLIKLTNVSLTPNQQLGRMIYSFSATATEMAEATEENLKKYGIARELTDEIIAAEAPLWEPFRYEQGV